MNETHGAHQELLELGRDRMGAMRDVQVPKHQDKLTCAKSKIKMNKTMRFRKASEQHGRMKLYM